MDEIDVVLATGKKHGIDEAITLYTSKIVVEEWVNIRCQFGCAYYGKSWSCPPNSFDIEKTRALLREYKRAVLVIGPGEACDKAFWDGVIDIEEKLHLNGFPKAFSMIMGPCPYCPKDGIAQGKYCSKQSHHRASLLGVGINIYSTLQRFKKNVEFRDRRDIFPAWSIILID